MKAIGYEIKKGRYLSIKNEQTNKFMRTKTLGINYMKNSIKYRIDQERFYGRRTFKSVKDLIKKHQRYMNRGNNIARKILNFLNPNQMVENYFTEAA